MAYAQAGEYSMGGRSRAMGGADVTLSGAFSPFTNIGSAAFSGISSLCFSAGNLYGIEGLNYAGAGYQKQLTNAVLAVSLYRFGDRLLNEHKLGVGYSHKIRFVSIGFQLNYLQLNVGSFGVSGRLIPEFGGLAELIPGVFVGAYMFNILPLLTDPENKTGFPASLKAGISYHPSKNLMLNLDVHDRLNEGTIWCAGLEYGFREKIIARIGVRSDPVRYSFGWGLPLKRINVDYALDLNPLLGMSNQVSLNYLIRKK